MKALLGKELRENTSLGLIGLVILSGLLILGYRECTGLSAVTTPIYDSRSVITQPLLASFLLREIAIFCAGFAAVLGWMQIHRERHRDLWAFLIHRPISRTQILVAKLVAGLSLYLVMVGLPLLVLVLWVSVPGHVFAPFEWRMVGPVAGCWLAGVVYYLAGVVTGLRQARWYASRALAAGAALAVTVATLIATNQWWVVPAAVLTGSGILGLAAWGSFLESGHFRGQPALGKLGLLVALTVGSFIITTVAAAFIGNALVRSGDYTSFYYQMGKNGTIYRWVHLAGQPTRLETLDGKPATDPKTGHVSSPEQLAQRLAPGYMIGLEFTNAPPGGRSAWDASRFFQVWQASPQEVWYYSVHDGRVIGFNVASRRVIGALGPNGFTRQTEAPRGGFRPPSANLFTQQHHTAITASTIYEVNVETRSVRPLLTVPPGDSLGGATDISSSNGWDYTLAASRTSVVLLSADGRPVWQIPREPATPAYTDVRAFFLEATNEFAVWFAPSYSANQKANATLPTYVAWVDASRGEVRRTTLPALPTPQFTPGIQEPLLASVWPPALSLALGERMLSARAPYRLVMVSLACAVLCAALAWWLTRRSAFSARAQTGWVLFHLAFGIPGLLAFLALQEWPARETCPGCHKRRVVDRETCEHCGTRFSPPPPTGTEIFETTLN